MRTMKRGADRQQIVTEEAEVVGGVARQPGWAGDVASDAARLNWTNWKNEEADQADSLPGSVD